MSRSTSTHIAAAPTLLIISTMPLVAWDEMGAVALSDWNTKRSNAVKAGEHLSLHGIRRREADLVIDGMRGQS